MMDSKAYVLILTHSGTEDSIISQLTTIPSIQTAFGTFGTYDILTKLVSDNEEKILSDISNKIRRISQIRSTMTLLVDKKPGMSKITDVEKEVLEKYMVQAYIAIHCSKSDEEHILKDLKKIPEIIEADLLLGNFEIMCTVAAPTYNEISDIVTKQIRKIPKIKSTITSNIIYNQGFSR